MFVFLLVIGASAIALQWTVHAVWERTLREQIERNLRQKTLMLAYRVEADRQHSLGDIVAQEGQAAGARATVVDPTGKVLADSEADPSVIENHSQRPEIIAALSGKVGVSERSSQSFGVPFLYVAVPVSGGAVRLAYPLTEMETTDRPLAVALFWGSLATFVFAVIVAAAASQYLGRRLERIVNFAERVAGGDLTARIASRKSGSRTLSISGAFSRGVRGTRRFIPRLAHCTRPSTSTAITASCMLLSRVSSSRWLV